LSHPHPLPFPSSLSSAGPSRWLAVVACRPFKRFKTYISLLMKKKYKESKEKKVLVPSAQTTIYVVWAHDGRPSASIPDKFMVSPSPLPFPSSLSESFRVVCHRCCPLPVAHTVAHRPLFIGGRPMVEVVVDIRLLVVVMPVAVCRPRCRRGGRLSTLMLSWWPFVDSDVVVPITHTSICKKKLVE
jgi:hypothetical protein